MLFFPDWLIAMTIFPGVVAHEIAHYFFCDLTGTPVTRSAISSAVTPPYMSSMALRAVCKLRS